MSRGPALVSAVAAAVLGAVLLAVPASQAQPVSRVALAAPVATTAANEKVIMDVDMGQLNDDAVAMFMLANSKKVDLLGITVVAGNTWVEEGTAYSLRQLELIKHQNVPVVPGGGEPLMGSRQATLAAEQDLFGNLEYMGAYARQRPPSYRELATTPYGGYPTTKPSTKQAAAQFIADQVKKYPNQVTLFVLGPATNVALAVRTYPEIVPLVKQVIYMGGAIDIPGNTSPAAEFNWWFDPESAKIVLRTPFKRQLVVPNDVAERVFYTKKEYDRIVSGRDTPLTRMFRDLQGPRFQADPARQSFVWDSITSAVFLDPSIATKIEDRYVDVDTTFGPDYGRSLGYGPSRNRDMNKPENFPGGTQKVQVLFDINRDAFWNLYVDLMTRPI
ncbi:nucleoside hydrolase [Micromonospora sp. DR5-3]|uniref:nucleoside hydrolase n=1 Tax=unclassified Micromonospora TaxID=2617518 RepID=UPI002105E284|nr:MULTISPECIES: nucleoside hydrolase [unclassified Micromonospora]MCW3819048.1 nucleoside hydrolase [Micromonospora sp. DR5-3]